MHPETWPPSRLVLKYMTAAKDAGFGVVFITHNPHHAHMVGDHFVLLNRGKQKLDCTYDEIDLEHLAQEMAGGDELAALSHELRGKGAYDQQAPPTQQAGGALLSTNVMRPFTWAKACWPSPHAIETAQ